MLYSNKAETWKMLPRKKARHRINLLGEAREKNERTNEEKSFCDFSFFV